MGTPCMGRPLSLTLSNLSAVAELLPERRHLLQRVRDGGLPQVQRCRKDSQQTQRGQVGRVVSPALRHFMEYLFMEC